MEVSDNCSDGCAEVYLSASVSALGTTYRENSVHGGDIYGDFVFGPFVYDDISTKSQSVPAAPSIRLQSINATNPNAVVFTYALTGASLAYSIFDFPPYILRSSNNTFTVDQKNYIQGMYIANMVGYLYGIRVQGPQCYIKRTNNTSVHDTWAWPVMVGGDEFAPLLVTTQHFGANLVTTINYCISPVSGTKVTSVTVAFGSISTLDADPGSERDLSATTEVFGVGP
jgi:hypothetical protein